MSIEQSARNFHIKRMDELIKTAVPNHEKPASEQLPVEVTESAMKFRRKVFATLTDVYKQQSIYEDKESFFDELKLRTGLYKEHTTLKGTTIYILDSISVKEMDDNQFQEFANKAINICLKYFVDKDNHALIEALTRF